jgi:hypothetical protein
MSWTLDVVKSGPDTRLTGKDPAPSGTTVGEFGAAASKTITVPFVKSEAATKVCETFELSVSWKALKPSNFPVPCGGSIRTAPWARFEVSICHKEAPGEFSSTKTR